MTRTETAVQTNVARVNSFDSNLSMNDRRGDFILGFILVELMYAPPAGREIVTVSQFHGDCETVRGTGLIAFISAALAGLTVSQPDFHFVSFDV